MSDSIKAPHVIANKTLAIGKNKFNLHRLEVKQPVEHFPSNDKTMSGADKHLSCAQVYKGLLYVFDGVDTFNVLTPHKNNTAETLLKAQGQLCAKQILAGCKFFSSALLNDEIYLLGKKETATTITNQLVKFNIQTGEYSSLQWEGDRPDFREHALIQSINNMYLVLYGGYTHKQRQVYSDAFIYIFHKWVKLNCVNQITPKFKFSSSSLGNDIYIHGGQAYKNESIMFFSDLYLLKISDTQFKIEYQLLTPIAGSIPSARSGHSMSCISERYLLIFGGQSKQKVSDNKFITKTFNDCWLFDIFQRQWSEIKLKMTNFFPRNCVCTKAYQNKVYIFGGYDAEEKAKLDIHKLEFVQIDKSHPKQSSSLTYKNQDIKMGDEIQLATSLVHSTSYELKFIFQAIQRIVEYTESVNSKNVRIYSEITSNTLQKFIYVSIEFDHQKNHQTEKYKNLELQKLPYYCFRLGKTMLYIENNPETFSRTVYLNSADGRFAPLVQRMQIKYRYTQNTQTGLIQNKQQRRNKDIIFKILQSLIEDPVGLLRQVKKSKIMIFSSNIIPTTKTYYYELVFDSATDVGIFKNNKKAQLLEKIKYDLSSQMEFSLHSYLKYSKSQFYKGQSNQTPNNYQKIFLSNSNQPIPLALSYADYLQEFCKKQKIIKIDIQLEKLQFVNFIRLFACQNDFYLPENNGILIYQNGRLINRYESSFGSLLMEKFYEKKFLKTNKNMFPIVGEIHVSDELKLINFKTQFQNTRKYLHFRMSLQKQLKTAMQKISPIIHDKLPKNKNGKQNQIMNKQSRQTLNLSIKRSGSNENILQRKKSPINQNSIQNESSGTNNVGSKRTKLDVKND